MSLLKRAHALNLLLAIFSLGISLVIGEGFLRLFIAPIDYLVPEVLPDAKRSLRIEPHSTGHDAGGYRNAEVPSTADIVVVGDSQTYSVATSAERSWPRALARGLGKTVYSLAVPGYNPVDYWSLVEDEAFAFKPRVLVVALYYGNDLREAFRSVYGKEYWKDLRRAELATADVVREETAAAAAPVEPPRLLGGFRHWLSGHSVLYRIVTDQLREKLRLGAGKARGVAGEAVVFEDRDARIQTALTPTHRLSVMDLDDPKVEEGLRLTLEMFRRMHGAARAHGVTMLAVLIPTKETVLWPEIVRHKELPSFAELRKLSEAEVRVDARVRAAFDADGLPYVAVRDSLREAVARREAVYPFGDGHPNPTGCDQIAAAVRAGVQALGSVPVVASQP